MVFSYNYTRRTINIYSGNMLQARHQATSVGQNQPPSAPSTRGGHCDFAVIHP